MKTQTFQRAILFALILVSSSFTACGGGPSGSGSQSTAPPPARAQLTITTPSILPGTLINSAYRTTLHASNGVGSLTWSIAPFSPTALFVTGLSIDPVTGVLSGTANFAGTAGFVATVKDSASPPQTATQSFYLSASGPLQAPPPQTFNVGQYGDVNTISLNNVGGVAPLSFSLSSGALPFGLRLGTTTGQITGNAAVVGTYPLAITIQDSYTPPEVVSAQVTIQVIPPPLSIANSVPQQILLNRAFSGRIVSTGGIPPYRFTMVSGSLPAGLSAIDPSSGQFSGSPTALGSFFFTVSASDSSAPMQTASTSFYINVVNPIGRNDTVATATPIGNGMINASISPYIDPPTTPAAGDNDYYKLISLSGNVVHVETFAQRWWPGGLLDTVVEIVDGNGNQQTTCRQPGSTSTNFASPCLNDDIPNPPTTDSALDFQVPGSPNTATTFYVHVLDWRGDARPDMRYALNVSGLVPPLSIQTTSLSPAARGLAYTQQLSAANAIGTVTWSVSSGTLPPGLTLNSAGSITGSATLNGTYGFNLVATDSGSPPQTATVPLSIRVVDPVKITSPAVWPNACVNQPYTFAMQASGGLAPLYWSFYSGSWDPGINLDQSTGIFSGSPANTGTFTGTVGVTDNTQAWDSQQVKVTVAPCSGG